MKLVQRLGLVLPALLLTACQIPIPQQVTPPRMFPEQAPVSVAGATTTRQTSSTPSSATYTVKRGTLQDSLSLSGKVVPGRSAQLTLKSGGTVTAVHVTPNQSVKQGDVLVEFALDDDSLQSARSQAQLAQLAYETEQEKLSQLLAPASNDSIQQIRITIEQDQANIQKLQQEQTLVQATNDRADKLVASNQSAADRKVALAEQQLQAANDAVTAAQANLKQAQEDAQTAQQKGVSDQQQAAADAAGLATTASAAVRVASHQLDQAMAKLESAQSQPATATATEQLETQQLRVQQDKDAAADADAAVGAASSQSPSLDHTSRQIAGEVAAAKSAAKAAQRTLASDSLDLKHMQSHLESAKAADAGAIKEASYAVDVAKEQLASAQQAEQQAQQKAQSVAKQPAPSTPPRASLQTVQAAQAAVQQAQANVRTAEMNLEDARTQQSTAGDSQEPPAQFADHSLSAARAQLAADQAKLDKLQSGNSTSEVAREQTRVNLLRDQATAAAAAAQPVMLLKAPFDGTVVQVGVSTGQTLTQGTPQEANGGAAQIPGIRVVATGANSIVADASESDVAQLSPGQSMDLSFPGVPGATATGKIVDVGAVPTVTNNQTTYPVRIELQNEPPNIKFGMTAQATVQMNEAKDVLIVPRRAIRSSDGQATVDKYDSNGQLQSVPVNLGRTFGTNVELLGGVAEGDVIAVYEGVNTTPNSSARQP